MKKMVAVGLVGLAVGLAMPGVFAQAPQGGVQKWEQFCEEHGNNKRGFEKMNASAAAHGQNGYQLVSGAASGSVNQQILCYRRPAR